MIFITAMAKHISRSLIVFAIGSIFLSGCLDMKEAAKYLITPPGPYSQNFAPLDLKTVMNISEATKLVSDTQSGPVAAAQYFPGKNKLLVVYPSDGFLRAWDIGEANVLFEHAIGVASRVSVDFDATGDLVIGATHHDVREDDYGDPVDFVGGITVWNTRTGVFVYCVVHPCNGEPSQEELQANSFGATLHPQGKWVIEQVNVGISVLDINGAEIPYGVSLGRPGHMRHIAQITFDPSDERYAIAFYEGEVLIEKIGEESLSLFAPKIRLGTYEERTRHKVTALNFSPNGQWLARIQDDILTIWTIAARSGKLHHDIEIADGQMLAFDQLSKLLFVGTPEKIQVLDVHEMQFIGEFITPEITSMSISSDNRLLIWGDKNGSVHVWGIP